MSPQEKAHQLYDKFYGIPLYIKTVKECCYIAIDEIIKSRSDDQGFDGVSDQFKDITFTDSVYRANTFDVHVRQTYKKTVRFQYKKDGVISDREVGVVDDSGQYIEGFDFTKNEYRKFFKNQIVLGSYFVKADVE